MAIGCLIITIGKFIRHCVAARSPSASASSTFSGSTRRDGAGLAVRRGARLRRQTAGQRRRAPGGEEVSRGRADAGRADAGRGGAGRGGAVARGDGRLGTRRQLAMIGGWPLVG